MVLLTFHLGPDLYGINVGRVQRVLPMVELKTIPQAPPFVCGLANLHGLPLPVVDLCMLALGRPCQQAMSTRIVQVALGDVVVGLMAESVSEIARVDDKEFRRTGAEGFQTAYLGPVANVNGSLLQLVDVDELLPEPVLALLGCLE